MKAVRIHQYGGPDVLCLEDVKEPQCRPTELLVAVKACGVNYIDIYFREGIYPAALPLTLGLEGAGVVVEAGREARSFKAGDRVAYIGPMGSYAEKAVVPSSRAVRIPESLSFEQGAASMVQGITAHYLTRSTCRLEKDEWCLIHAATGGVGLLLCQMARLSGARIIGTVSTKEKADLSAAAGAEHIIYCLVNKICG